MISLAKIMKIVPICRIPCSDQDVQDASFISDAEIDMAQGLPQHSINVCPLHREAPLGANSALQAVP